MGHHKIKLRHFVLVLDTSWTFPSLNLGLFHFLKNLPFWVWSKVFTLLIWKASLSKMPALNHLAFLFATLIELTKSIKVELFPKIMNILSKIICFNEHKERCNSIRYLIDTNILINLNFLQHITNNQFSLPGMQSTVTYH